MYLSVETRPFIRTSALPANDRCDGLLDAFHVVGFVDDVEGVDVDAVLLADLFDDLLVAEERRLHEPLLIGFVDALPAYANPVP